VVSLWVELGEVVCKVEVPRAVHWPNVSGFACVSDAELAHCNVARELCGFWVVGQLDGRHVIHKDGYGHDS